MSHTTAPLEVVGTLVRTKMTADGGGFLVAEFRDGHGVSHNDEAKANARLFRAAGALLEVASLVQYYANDHMPAALIDAANAAISLLTPERAGNPIPSQGTEQ